MFPCLKKGNKPEVVKPIPVESKTEEPNRPEQVSRCVIIVGHNSKSQGAVNYLKESEFVFNSRVARKVINKLAEEGYQVPVIFRPAGKSYSAQVADVIKQLDMVGCDFAIELHYNFYSSAAAKGCEVLIVDTIDQHDNIIAEYFARKINSDMGIPLRHGNGVKTIPSGHSGYGMLKALKDSNRLGILVEPCFASNRDEAKLFFENEDQYVDVLVETILKTITK